MKLLRSRGANLLLMLLLLFAGVPPLAQADAGPWHFSVSADSGRPGLAIEVRQIDPCPQTDGEAQYVELSFVDAAGVTTLAPSPAYVGPPGDWGWTELRMSIPSKDITSLDPLTYSTEAAAGVGWLHVRCYKPTTDSYTVTREYEPQSFTVTGPTPQLHLSSGRVTYGDVLQISSTEPCPQVDSLMDGGITNEGLPRLLFTPTVDPVSGAWHSEVTITPTYPDPMAGPRPFPVGKYMVGARCYSPEQFYQSEVLEVVPPPLLYGAYGDSYSSGQGTFDYYDTGNNCHRSRLGYPQFVDEQLQLGEFVFAACSGAVTDDFYAPNPNNSNEPAQLSRLTPEMQVVTLTIGGNDVDFAGVLDRCVDHPGNEGWGCSTDKTLERKISKQLSALEGKERSTIRGRPVHSLLELYRSIHNKAPSAKIYVGGYPSLFGEDKGDYQKTKEAPSGAICLLPVIASVDYKDAKWLNRQAERFNRVIFGQIQKAQQEGIKITYVPAALFGGHALCDDLDPWFHGVVFDDHIPPGHKPESFHPISEGYQWGYGEAFRAVISQAK